MRVLPPEAYTNRELAQAFAWLATQPEHIQRLGTSKEAVISLFKRAYRGGDQKMTESPTMSSDAFQSDLKNLADVVRTFDGPKAPPASTFQAPPAPVQQSNLELDERSWKMIQMVKTELNLSHDMEAIRLLIKLGFERISSVLPSASI
jgi:hypothetical protein